MSARRPIHLLIVFGIVAGVVLRLAWPDDIHYLGDEAWTFRHVEDAREGGSWAALGMPSSRGVKNAGMSVWVFIVLGMISRAATPPGLTRAVAVLAIIAHVAAFFVPLRLLKDEEEKKQWTWAIILTLTNPILIFLERKIWAQSVLPIFMIGLVIAWMRRDTRPGSLVWGLLGAIIGQIHMAGFFFAPALALWTKLFGDKTPDAQVAKKARWSMWILGSAIGAAPAIPWLLYLARDRPPANASEWWLRFRLEFYQYFFSDPTSMSGEYILGKDILTVMKYPIVANCPTYLVGVADGVLAVASFVIALRAVMGLWERRRDWKSILKGGGTDTGVLIASTLAGMGVLMTLPSISIHRHYMLATFPIQYVWTARAALRKPGGEKWLAVLFAGGLVVSAGILSYVHATGENAEMGKTYATQQRLGIAPEDAKPKPPAPTNPSGGAH